MTITSQNLQRLAIQLKRRYPRIGAGLHEGTKTGNGLSPLPARPYEPGDSLRHIAWPETAKFGELMTREFVPQFDARTLVITDLSDAMIWGGGESLLLKSELAGYCAEALAQLLVWQGDSVGHIVAGGTIARTPLMRNQNSVLALRRIIRSSASDNKDNFVSALRIPLRERHQKELIIVISDFMSEEAWETPLLALSHRFDVVAVQIVDPWDLDLPDIGTILVKDGSKTRRVNTSSVKTRQTYHQDAVAHDGHIASVMRSGRIWHIKLDTSRLLLDQLVRAFSRTNRN